MSHLDGDVDVIEQLCMVFDGGAGREEHHDLLAQVLFEEGKEQQEALLRWHHAIALLKALAGRLILFVVNAHIQRLPLEGQPG